MAGVPREPVGACPLHPLRLRPPQLLERRRQVRGRRHPDHPLLGALRRQGRRHRLHRPHRQGERQQRQAHRPRQAAGAEGGGQPRARAPGARHGHFARARLARHRGQTQDLGSVPRARHLAHHH